MDPRPEPEKKPEAQPSPQADAKAAPAPRPGAPARGAAEAYTDMPDFKAPQKNWWPFVLALGLAGAAAGLGLRHHSGTDAAPPPAAAPQGSAVLAYSAADFDAGATAAAKQILARDAQTHELAALDHERRAEHALPAKPDAPSPARQAALALAAGPQTLRDGVADGRVGFYTFKLAELVDEGGDVYDISVDGVPLMRLTTSRELKSVTLPMDVSKPHTVTQTLVFARPRTIYAKNGTGGPPPETRAQSSLTIQSSGGEVRGHAAAPGESDSWTAQFHGTLGGGR